MKKIRGKKRYFRELWKTVHNTNLDVSDDSWYDYKHFHLDFYGLGNYSAKMRKNHIQAHMSLCDRFLRQLSTYKNSYQCWIVIDMNDASADAVYIHTENPNNTLYPNEFEGVNWECQLPEILTDTLNIEKYLIGYFTSEFGEAYILKPKQKYFFNDEFLLSDI